MVARSSTGPNSRPKRKSDGPADVPVPDAADTTAVAAAADTAEKEFRSSERAPKRRKLPLRERAGKTAVDQGDQDGQDDQEQSANIDEAAVEIDDSDNDDAPEAISTARAFADTRQSAQRAHRAAEQSAEEQKRRRRDRDTRLKAQAAIRKARDDDLAEAEAKKAKKAKAAPDAQPTASPQPQPPSAASKLLPLELLEDSDDEDDSEDDDNHDHRLAKTTAGAGSTTKKTRASKKPRQPPRDRRLGTTVYRLLVDSGPRSLAPKLGKQARNIHDALVARRRKVGRLVSGDRRDSARSFIRR